jgi:hypothetical protein
MPAQRDELDRIPWNVRILNKDGSDFVGSGGVSTGTATIPTGQSLSGAVNTGGSTLAGILMPAVWSAAVLTFQVSNSLGGTYQDLYDDQGNEVTVQAAASRAIGIDATLAALGGWQFLKLRSGTAAAPVVQGAGASFGLVYKG